MSKVDAQRAMREAKYARNSASGLTRREAAAAAGDQPASPAPSAATAPVKKAPAKAAPAAAAATEGELCGHKSMNGRACTRPAGHAEKNHRYG